MAFQTNVLRGGAWVTEMVDLRTLLKANSSAKGSKRPRQLKPPQCGILTKTVFESQLVNSILPVRLRSPRQNDIAFLGDNSVQIFELKEDSRLVEIASKSDFGSRIRNAAVIGSFNINDAADDIDDQEGALPGSSSSTQDPFDAASQLPPQMLMLVLEFGACVFLFLRPTQNGQYEFVTVYSANPKPQVLYLGFHLAVDPSSRYMVQANHQEHFFVYELESREALSKAYSGNQPLNPIRCYRPRSIQGVIHKVVFLHPHGGNDRHIILLLLIVRNGKTRMVTYEWELGDNLKAVFQEEKHGYRIPSDCQLPLLVIPLTVKSAFVMVSEKSTTVCTEGLHGPPKLINIALENPPPTKTHYGKLLPLWTTWVRPLRLSPYFRDQDCIYLAREDGVVMYIEADQDGELNRSTPIHTVDCNISRAFACAYHRCNDALVIGGISGTGGIWKVPPIEALELLSTLPTIAPTLDFVTTDQSSSWNQSASSVRGKYQSNELGVRKADRLFTASGCGTKGAISEYRHGLKADLELEFEYGPGVRNLWLFPSRYAGAPGGFDMLLSLPDGSAALHINSDLDEVSDLEPNTVPYELSSTTLALDDSETLLVQITQRSVTLLAPNKSARYTFDKLLKHYPNAIVSDACILNGYIACSFHAGSRHHIRVFKVDVVEFCLINEQTLEVDGEITCLAMTGGFLVAGVWRDGQPFLATCVRTVPPSPTQLIDLQALLSSSDASSKTTEGRADSMEPIESIVCINDTILLGTRSGEVITLTHVGDRLSINLQKFGMTRAHITCNHASEASNTTPAAFVCCDGNLVMLQLNPSYHPSSEPYVAQLWTRFYDLQVYPVDEQNSTAPAPPIDFGVAVSLSSNGPDFKHILMVSGSKLLLGKLNQKPGPVHRQIPIAGTPSRLIWSSKLRCLIAAVTKDDKATLKFIDPDTGEDIGMSTDKNGNPVDFIGSLGKTGDAIYGLEEWKFKNEGLVWEYILVSTRLGRLIVVDTEKVSSGGGRRRMLRYWARFTLKEREGAIYSVLGCDGGLIYCAGNRIYWYILDTESKKLKRLKSFELPCIATSLQISNGKLMALTSRDSLLVIDHSMDDSSATGLCHADPKSRNATHMMEVAGTQLDEPMGSITLVADRDCGVGGLWVPWQSPQKNCEPVFEVELEASVRRFRRGRTRPSWERPGHSPRYGRLMSTVDDAEILGISLDGSLRHFTLLELDIWRLLRFIQNLALTNVDLCPLLQHRGVTDMADFDPEPKVDKGLEMQVDGDTLRRCLDKGALGALLSQPRHAKRFIELLDGLEAGKYTANLPLGEDKLSCYVLLAHDIMEYYLRSPL